MADRKPGDSYLDDTYYRPIEAPLEAKYGLPDGLLASIRKDGERTDKGRVSSAGARSVYQIIPSTRDLFLNKYGVNAYSGDAAAAQVAALHLQESYKRSGGNLERTIREYHGGTNPANWGTVNDAYVSRVMGKSLTVPARGTTVLAPDVDLSQIDVTQLAGVRPADIGSRKPLGKEPVTPADVAPKPTGAGIILQGAQNVDVTPGSDQATAAPSLGVMRDAVATEWERSKITGLDRLEAGMDRNWISSLLTSALDRQAYEGDPEWHREYLANIDNYESYAKTQDELDELRSSRAQNSREDFFAVVANIDGRRRLDNIINSNGTGWAYDLGTALADPIGWVATEGVGKVVQATSAFARTGKAALAASSSLTGRIVEGGAVNVGFTALQDAAGEQQSVGAYLRSGAVGVALGSALHGLSNVVGKADNSDAILRDTLDKETARVEQEIRSAAVAKVGLEADEATIEKAMQAEVVDRATRVRQMAVMDRPDTDRFLPLDADLTRTADANARQAVITANGLDAIPIPEYRALAAELQVRSEQIANTAMANGALDKGLEGRFLRWFGQESDALTMLRSNNPLLQATAIQLLESTTGAGGRKPSAAISLVMRERSYMEHMVGYDQAYDLWRRGEGIGKVSSMLSPEARNAFDRAVFREVEARGMSSAELTTNPAVKRGADAWERGMTQMREEMQRIGTLGNERLGSTSVGYMRHMIDPRKLMGLTAQQRRNVEAILAQQFQRLNEYSYVTKEGEKVVKNFDAKFSRELAKQYIGKAVSRAKGSAFIPANLHTSEGASIVEDAVTAMQGLAPEDKAALLGKFSRGGPSFTKGRLNFDMSAEIGDGMQLGDLFNQDLLGLYRSYARRTAGEVALAQYGILGKQTLHVMRSTAEATGASIKELEAFDRVVSEFVNEPMGRGAYDNTFKNLRSVTSSSMLGGMGFTQLGELGNALPAVGIRGILGNISGAKRMLDEVRAFRAGKAGTNPILKDFDEVYGFLGGDEYNMTRLFDAPDQSIELYGQESIGTMTKAIRAGAHLTSVASGFRMIHAVQVRGMSEQIAKKAIRYIHLGKESKALDSMGITEEIRTAFKAGMDKLAEFDSRGNLTKLDLFADHGIEPRIIQDFAQTIERGAGQIIQKTYIGETGPWAHSEFLKLMLQFRTFGITSIEKQYGRNRANYGAVKAAAVMIGGAAFALPIHLARVEAQSLGMSKQKRQEFIDQKTNAYALSRALLAYTSASGLLPDMMDLVSTFGNKVGVIPNEMADEAGIRGRQAGLANTVPGIGYADNVYKGTLGVDFKRLPKLLPGANLPFVTPIVNGLSPEDE